MNSTPETTPASTGTTPLNPPVRRFGCGVYNPDQVLLFQCGTIEQANRAVEMINALAAEVIRLSALVALLDTPPKYDKVKVEVFHKNAHDSRGKHHIVETVDHDGDGRDILSIGDCAKEINAGREARAVLAAMKKKKEEA